MRQSLRDYTIYFLTLVFGISTFYMFNALGSQSVLNDFFKLSKNINQSDEVDIVTKSMFSSLENSLNYVSVFVALILGFLVIYANAFMIRRRKKEFGVYLILGMNSITISEILLIETLTVALVSLAVGLALGVLLSQLMSVFVIHLFGLQATSVSFVFSMDAMLKTCLYFGIMFIFTLIINLISVSATRLIRLLNATHRVSSEKVKKTTVSVIGFIIGAVILIGVYLRVVLGFDDLVKSPVQSIENLPLMAILLILGTFLIIVSLSGFLLSLLSVSKKLRLTGLNVFIIKQLGSRLYSTVLTMTITTLILTLTMTTITASVSYTDAMRTQMNRNYPIDIMITRSQLAERQSDNGKITTIYDEMQASGYDMSLLREYEEFEMQCYTSIPMTLFFSEEDFEYLKSHKLLDTTLTEDSLNAATYEQSFDSWFEVVLYESDYNKMAKLYHLPQLSMKDDEYAFISNMEGYRDIMDKKLSEGYTVEILGKKYHPAMSSCIVSSIYPSFIQFNRGTLVIPDGSKIYDESTEADRLVDYRALIANYDDSKMPRRNIDRIFNGGMDELTESGVPTPNEYAVLWQTLTERGMVSQEGDDTLDTLTEGLIPIRDAEGIIAYQDEAGVLYTVNDDQTGLQPFNGTLDIESLWEYNRRYACQFGYAEGYIEHVNADGYPTVYEDADGKLYMNQAPEYIVLPDGTTVETVGHLTPIDAVWEPEDSDFIYSREEDCLYELLKDGSRMRIELSEIQDIYENNSAFLPNNNIYYYMAFSRVVDVEIGQDQNACVLYITLYVGLVFLMACAAILGLKQLSDSADNKERYLTLRRIGCSEKMINRAYLKQLLFFFLLPLAIAMIHSVFILTLVIRYLSVYIMADLLVRSVVFSVWILASIYVSFLLVTWFGCKRMIRDGIRPDKTE